MTTINKSDKFDDIDLFYKSFKNLKNKPKTVRVHSISLHNDSTGQYSVFVTLAISRKPHHKTLKKLNVFSLAIQNQLQEDGFPYFCYIDFALSDNTEQREMNRIKAQKRKLERSISIPTATTSKQKL